VKHPYYTAKRIKPNKGKKKGTVKQPLDTVKVQITKARPEGKR